jgi:hypothetical protein
MTFIFDHTPSKKLKRKYGNIEVQEMTAGKSVSFLNFVQSERNIVLKRQEQQTSLATELAVLQSHSVKLIDSSKNQVDFLEQRMVIRRQIVEKQKELQLCGAATIAEFDRKIMPFLDLYYSKSQNPEITDEMLVTIYKQEFFSENAAPRMHAINMDFCVLCEGEYVYSSEDSMLYCVVCGYTTQYIDANSASIAYGDEIEYTSFSYKRINHLNEWLNHFQAKETTPVPDIVLMRIMNYLYEKRFTDPHKITYSQIKKAQKYLGLNKYYDQTMQIWCRLTGRKPLRLDPVCEEKIKLMFIRIQVPFDKHCPKTRKNFLSYPYCMYKFCQLLGYDYLLPYFSLLKGKDKLLLQEKIFKKICKDLDWKFVPINIE